MAALLNHCLSATFLIPLIGTIALLLLTSDSATSRARSVAMITAAASLLATSGLWVLYDPDGKTWQFAERYEVTPSFGASIYFGVDGTSILFLLLASVISFVAMLLHRHEMTAKARDFYAVVLLAQAGMFGVFMALDLLIFFVCWQVTVASVHELIRRSHAPAARKFLVASVVVSLLMFAGMVALYFANPIGTAPYSSDLTLLHTRTLPRPLQIGVFAAFALAFAATMSLFPFHRWMVNAQTAASSATCALLAGVLVPMGAYGVFRLVLPIVPDASRQLAPVIALLAIVSSVFGAFSAWRQTELKRLLGYATVSQAGVIVFGLFTLTPVGVGGGVVRQFGHGVWIAALFACAAIIHERSGSRDIAGAAGLRRAMPALSALLYVVAVAAAALSGPLRLLEGWRFGGSVLASVVSLASIFLTLAYLVPLVRRTFSGDFAGQPGFRRRLTSSEAAILVPLAAIAVALLVNPQPVLQHIETSVGRVVARIHPEMAPHLRLGSDCPTAAAPDPAGPPPGFILVQPCAEGH